MDGGTVETTYLVNIRKALEAITQFESALKTNLATVKQQVEAAGASIEHFNAEPIASPTFVAQSVQGLNKVSGSMAAFKQVATASLSGVKGALEAVAGSVGTLQGLLAGLGTAGFFSVAKDFDKAVTNLRVTLGLTEKQFATTRSEIVRFSRDMSVAATDTANALDQIARSGYRSEAAFTVLRAGVAGAKATLGDVVQTTTTLAEVLRGFNIPVSEAARVMDQMVVASTTAHVSLDAIGLSVAKLGPQARALGVDFGELLGIVTLISHQGGDAAATINELRLVMFNMTKGAGDAGKQIQALLHTTAEASIRNIGFTETLRLLIQRAGETTGALEKIFPSARQANSILALSTATAKEMDEIFGKIAGGSAADLQHRMEEQRGSFAALASSIGKLLALPLIEYFEEHRTTIIAATAGLKEFIKSHHDLIQAAVATALVLGTLTTAVTLLKGAMLAATLIITPIANLIKILITAAQWAGTVVTAMGGLGITLAGIGQLFAAAAGAAGAFLAAAAPIVVAVTAVAAAFYLLGRQITYAVNALYHWIVGGESIGEQDEKNKLSAEAKSYEDLASAIDKASEARRRGQESDDNVKKLAEKYAELSKATREYAAGNQDAAKRVAALRAEIEALGGDESIHALERKIQATADLFRQGSDNARFGLNARKPGEGIVPGSKNIDLDKTIASLTSTRPGEVDFAKKELSALALNAGVAESAVEKLVNTFADLVRQQDEAARAAKGLEVAEKDVAGSLVGQELEGATAKYKDLGDELEKLGEQYSGLGEEAGKIKGLDKEKAKLDKIIKDIRDVRKAAVENVGAGAFTPEQLAQFDALKALLDKTLATKQLIADREVEIQANADDKKAKHNESIRQAIEQNEIASLERQGRFKEAIERGAKLNLDKRLADIAQIRNAEGKADAETAASQATLRSQAYTDYQEELKRSDETARKKFLATEAGEKQRQEIERRKRQDAKQEEADLLAAQLKQSQKVGDIRTELAIREKLREVLKEMGNLQAAAAQKDAETNKLAKERLGLLRQELETQFKLQGRGADFSGPIQKAQAELAGSSDVLSFRGAARGVFQGVGTEAGIKQRGADIVETLKLEFQAAQLKYDEARRARDKQAQDEAVKQQEAVIEKNRILAQEIARAITEVRSQAANPVASHIGEAQAPTSQLPAAVGASPAQVDTSRFFKRKDGTYFDRAAGAVVTGAQAVDRSRAKLTTVEPESPLGGSQQGITVEPEGPLNAAAGAAGAQPGPQGPSAGQALTQAINGAVDSADKLTLAVGNSSAAIKDAFGQVRQKFDKVVDQLNINTRAITSQASEIQRLRIEGQISVAHVER